MSEKLKNIIKNKNVVIVGPSSQIDVHGDAEFIDSHDVVVRVNNCTIDEKHRGVKTDIVYFDGGHTRLTDHILHRGAELHIVFAYPRHLWFSNRFEQTHSALNQMGKQYSVVDEKWYDEFNANMNTPKLDIDVRPNTGTIAIFNVMSFDPKSLHIVGMDFHAHGYEKQNKLGGLTHDFVRNMMMEADGRDHHCPPRQFRKFIELYESNKDVMTLYPPLQELVENPSGSIL